MSEQPAPQLSHPAEGFLRSSDGLRLFYRRWEASSARAVCLLAHGLAEHSGRYEAAARILNRHNFSVWAMDHRGHGRSEGLRGDCRSLEDFVEDLDGLAQEARAQENGLPQVLVGHSLGGLIALAYAARFPERIRAVAVSSPALRLAHETPAVTVAAVTTVSRILPTTPFPNGVNPKILCHDPQVVRAYEQDPLVHRVITARCAVALRRAMRGSLQLAQKLKIPCLLLQAGDDRVCDPEAAAEFARASPNGAVTLRRYDGLYHEIFNEPQGENILEEACRWLEKVI